MSVTKNTKFLTAKFSPWHIVIHNLTYIMSIYLSALTTTIIPIDDNIYEVLYSSPTSTTGTCTYTKWISKLQPTGKFILTHCNMGDIISYINSVTPLSEGDLISLQQDIRNHSLNHLINNHLWFIKYYSSCSQHSWFYCQSSSSTQWFSQCPHTTK